MERGVTSFVLLPMCVKQGLIKNSLQQHKTKRSGGGLTFSGTSSCRTLFLPTTVPTPCVVTRHMPPMLLLLLCPSHFWSWSQNCYMEGARWAEQSGGREQEAEVEEPTPPTPFQHPPLGSMPDLCPTHPSVVMLLLNIYLVGHYFFVPRRLLQVFIIK